MLLGKLPEQWKALTALGGAFAIGSVFTMSALSFRGLPAQTRANTDSIQALSRRSVENRVIIDRVDDQYERIICILTLPDTIRPLAAERACQ